MLRILLLLALCACWPALGAEIAVGQGTLFRDSVVEARERPISTSSIDFQHRLARRQAANLSPSQLRQSPALQCQLGSLCQPIAWGTDYVQGKMQIPGIPGVSDIIYDAVAVVHGMTHGLVLRKSGDVIQWRHTDFPAPGEDPPSGVLFQQIAAGDGISIGLSTTGRVYTWGKEGWAGAEPLEARVDGAVARVCVSTVTVTGCILWKDSGSVLCFGEWNFWDESAEYNDLWCGGDQVVMRRARDGAFVYSGFGDAAPPNPTTLLDNLPVVDFTFGTQSSMALLANGSLIFYNNLQYYEGSWMDTLGTLASDVSLSTGLTYFYIRPSDGRVLYHILAADMQTYFDAMSVPTSLLTNGIEISVYLPNVIALRQVGCNVIRPSATDLSLTPPPTIYNITLVNDALTVLLYSGFFGTQNPSEEFRVFSFSVNGLGNLQFQKTRDVWLSAGAANDCAFIEIHVYSFTELSAQLGPGARVDNGSALVYDLNVEVTWTDALDSGQSRVSSLMFPTRIAYPYAVSVTSQAVPADSNNNTDSLLLSSYQMTTPTSLTGPNVLDVTFSINTPYPISNTPKSGTAPGPFTLSANPDAGWISPQCDLFVQPVGSMCWQSLAFSWAIPAGTCDVGGTYTQTFTRGCWSSFLEASSGFNDTANNSCPIVQADWTFTYTIPSSNFCAPALQTVAAATATIAMGSGVILPSGKINPVINVTSAQKKFYSAQIVTIGIRKENEQSGSPWYNRTLVADQNVTAFALALEFQGTIGQASDAPVFTFVFPLNFTAVLGTDPTLALLNNATDFGKRVPFTLIVSVDVVYFQSLPGGGDQSIFFGPQRNHHPKTRVHARGVKSKMTVRRVTAISKTFDVAMPAVALPALPKSVAKEVPSKVVVKATDVLVRPVVAVKTADSAKPVEQTKTAEPTKPAEARTGLAPPGTNAMPASATKLHRPLKGPNRRPKLKSHKTHKPLMAFHSATHSAGSMASHTPKKTHTAARGRPVPESPSRLKKVTSSPFKKTPRPSGALVVGAVIGGVTLLTAIALFAAYLHRGDWGDEEPDRDRLVFKEVEEEDEPEMAEVAKLGANGNEEEDDTAPFLEYNVPLI